jgi:hypothetical protein
MSTPPVDGFASPLIPDSRASHGSKVSNSPNLGVKEVDQTSASWNHITSWLRRVEALRDAA